jgi:hypothetical protein
MVASGAEGKPLRGVAAAKRAKGLKISHERLCRSTQSGTRRRVYRKVSLRPSHGKSPSPCPYCRQRRRTTCAHCSSVSSREIARHPPPSDAAWWGGSRFSQKIWRGPQTSASAMCCDSVAMRAVSRRCQLKSLRNERWRPPLDPRDRRTGSPNSKRGHDTGPERGPSLHVQGSVWRSCGSSLTLGTQAPDDRMEGFDPLRTFKIGPMNGRKARESGLWLKASVASGRPLTEPPLTSHVWPRCWTSRSC